MLCCVPTDCSGPRRHLMHAHHAAQPVEPGRQCQVRGLRGLTRCLGCHFGCWLPRTGQRSSLLRWPRHLKNWVAGWPGFRWTLRRRQQQQARGRLRKQAQRQTRSQPLHPEQGSGRPGQPAPAPAAERPHPMAWVRRRDRPALRCGWVARTAPPAPRLRLHRDSRHGPGPGPGRREQPQDHCCLRLCCRCRGRRCRRQGQRQ